MKRILCFLLVCTMLFTLCACADKKEKEENKTAEETEQTESTTEQTQTDPDLLVTAPDKDDKPQEIGTLPIIFGDGDETPPTSSSGTNQPTTTTKKPGTTKKPTTTTKKPSDKDPDKDNPLIGGDGNIVETPIIPFN